MASWLVIGLSAVFSWLAIGFVTISERLIRFACWLEGWDFRALMKAAGRNE